MPVIHDGQTEDVAIAETTPFVPKSKPFKEPIDKLPVVVVAETESEFTESVVAEVVASVVVAVKVCTPIQMFA